MELTAYVVESFLSEAEISSLLMECSESRREGVDLSDVGLSIDLFEDLSIPDEHPARIDPEEYFKCRWRDQYPSYRQILQNLITAKLSSLVYHVTYKRHQADNACKAIFLFNEHYVVKESNSKTAFRWHRDCDEQLCAFPTESRPVYYSAWCALDNVDANNGTLILDSRANVVYMSRKYPEDENSTEIVVSSQNSHASQLSVDFDDENGIILNLKAGSVVIFSSSLLHRSKVNQTDRPRRVYYAQYSDKPIVVPPTKSAAIPLGDRTDLLPRPLSFAIPCKVIPLTTFAPETLCAVCSFKGSGDQKTSNIAEEVNTVQPRKRDDSIYKYASTTYTNETSQDQAGHQQDTDVAETLLIGCAEAGCSKQIKQKYELSHNATERVKKSKQNYDEINLSR